MIKHIIFDIGNVLVTFDPIKYFSQYFDKKTNEFLCREVFTSEQWLHVDQGLLSETEAKAYFQMKLPSYRQQLSFLFDQWKGLMEVKEDSLTLLEDLKKRHYNIYLLSNIGEESYNYCRKQFPFFALADGGVYSYQEKLVKPNEALYRCLLNRYELLPGECIFLDDAQRNIEAAEKVGFHAILFTDCLAARQKIYTLLEEENHVEN